MRKKTKGAYESRGDEGMSRHERMGSARPAPVKKTPKRPSASKLMRGRE